MYMSYGAILRTGLNAIKHVNDARERSDYFLVLQKSFRDVWVFHSCYFSCKIEFWIKNFAFSFQ